MTSSTTRLSNAGVTGTKLKLAGRVLVDDSLEFVATHPWEVVTVNILLELRIGPEVGNQGELASGRRATHVTLTLPKLNRVPSSSQFPGG